MTKSHAMAMNTGVLTLLCLAPAAFGSPVTTGFNYQGRLTHLGQPVNSTADFQFRLYDSASGGNQVGALVTAHAVNVTGGLFSATLDFGIDPRSQWNLQKG